MATRFIVFPAAAPGTTPLPVITEVPDAPTTPILPGVSFNGSPAEMIQFLRDLGQLAPAPVIEPPPAPPTNSQRFMRLVEEGYWSFRGMLRGIYNLGVLVILLLLAGMALGYLPGITVPSNISFGSSAPISAPAPRSVGPSLSDRLGAIETTLGEVKGEVEGLKVQPQVEAPPVVEQAAPAPAPEPKRPFWKKKATTP